MDTDMFDLDDRTQFESVLEFTPDISELVIKFSWFQWMWFHNPVDLSKD